MVYNRVIGSIVTWNFKIQFLAILFQKVGKKFMISKENSRFYCVLYLLLVDCDIHACTHRKKTISFSLIASFVKIKCI